MSSIVLMQVEKKTENDIKKRMPSIQFISLENNSEYQNLITNIERGIVQIDCVVIGQSVARPTQIMRKIHKIDNNISTIALEGKRKRISGSDLKESQRTSNNSTSTLTRYITDSLRTTHEKRIQDRSVSTKDLISSELIKKRYIEKIVDVVPVGVILIDLYHIILAWNRSATGIFHTQEENALSVPFLSFFEKHEKRKLQDFLSSSGRLSPQKSITEIFNRDTGKKTQFLEITASRVDTVTGGIGLVLLVNNVTEKVHSEQYRKHAEKERKKLLLSEQHARMEAENARERFNFLAHASNILSSSLEYEVVLKKIAELAVSFLADYCVVDIIGKNKKLTRVITIHKERAMNTYVNKLKSFPPNPDSVHPLPAVLAKKRSKMIPRVSKEFIKKIAVNKAHLSILRLLNPTSYIAVPLYIGGTVLGAITFVSTYHSRTYTRQDLEIAKDLAYRAALSIENSRLYESANKEIGMRKNAERELRRSRDQLEAIFQSAAEGISVQDNTGKIIFVNDAAAHLSGFSSAKEMLKAPVQKILENITMLDESDKPFPLDRLPGRRALSGEENPEAIIKFKFRNANTENWSNVKARPLSDENGNIQYAVNVFHDITERKLTEEILTELNKKIANILESITDAFFALDESWQFTYVNREAEQLLKKTRDELIGKNIWNEFPDFVKTRFYKKCYEAFTNKTSVTFEQLYPPHAWLEVHVYPARDGLSVYFKDITERKQEEKRRDHFLGVASHELKTPLASIKAFIQILQKKVAEENMKEKYYFSRIDAQINKLTRLINDLLDVTRIRSKKLEFFREVFEFDEMIEEAIDSIKPTTKHTLLKQGQTKKLVLADRSRIYQVVTNLISNAIKYSPTNKKIIINLSSDRKGATVKVQDYGVGISDEQYNRLFEPFYQIESATREKNSGLGLGLYISSEIIRLHGGTIWAESKPGKGSTFAFTIPLKPREIKKRFVPLFDTSQVTSV